MATTPRSIEKPRWSSSVAKPSQPVWEDVSRRSPTRIDTAVAHQTTTSGSSRKVIDSLPPHHRKLMRRKMGIDGGSESDSSPSAVRRGPVATSGTRIVASMVQAPPFIEEEHHGEDMVTSPPETRHNAPATDDYDRAEAAVNDVSFAGALPNVVNVPIQQPTPPTDPKRRGNNKRDTDATADAHHPPESFRACAAVPATGMVWVGSSSGNVCGRDATDGRLVVPHAAAGSVKNGAINAMLSVTRRPSSAIDESTASHKGHQQHEAAAAATPEVWIACASKRLIVMCGETGEVVASSQMMGGGLCLAVASNGRHVLVGGADGRVAVWCVETCRQLFSIRGHREALIALASFSLPISPTGKSFTSNTENDGVRLFASASHDGELLVWGTSPNPSSPYAVVAEQSAAHDGDAIVSLAYVPVALEAVSMPPRSPPPSASKGGSRAGKGGRLEDAVENSPHGSKNINTIACVWSGSSSGQIKVWSAHKLSHLATLSGHTEAVTCLVHNHGERKVWSASLDGNVLAWDAKEFHVLYSLTQGSHQILAVTPVARASVWKLWVCAESGEGRVYLSQAHLDDGPALGQDVRTASTHANESRASPTTHRGSTLQFEAAEELAKARVLLEEADRKNQTLAHQLDRVLEEVRQLRVAAAAKPAAHLLAAAGSPLSSVHASRLSEVLDVTPGPTPRRRAPREEDDDDTTPPRQSVAPPPNLSDSAIKHAHARNALVLFEQRLQDFDFIEAEARNLISDAATSGHSLLRLLAAGSEVAATDLHAARRQADYWKGLVQQLQGQVDAAATTMAVDRSRIAELESDNEKLKATVTQLREQADVLRKHFVGSTLAAGSAGGTTSRSMTPSGLPPPVAPGSRAATPPSRSPSEVGEPEPGFPQPVPSRSASQVPMVPESQMQEALAALRKRHADEITVITAERTREVSSLRSAQEAEGSRIRAEQARATETIAQLRVALTQATEDARREANRYVMAADDKESLNATIQRLTLDVETAKAELETTRADQSSTIAALRAEIASLTSLHDASRDREKDKQVTIESLQQELELTKTLSKAPLDDAPKSAVLTVQLNAITAEADELRRRLRDAQALESEQQTQIASLTDALNSLETDRANLAEELRLADEQSGAKTAKLQADLLAMRGPWMSMKQALEESHKALEDARAEFVQQISILEDTVEEREREIELMRTQLQRAELRARKESPVASKQSSRSNSALEALGAGGGGGGRSEVAASMLDRDNYLQRGAAVDSQRLPGRSDAVYESRTYSPAFPQQLRRDGQRSGDPGRRSPERQPVVEDDYDAPWLRRQPVMAPAQSTRSTAAYPPPPQHNTARQSSATERPIDLSTALNAVIQRRALY